MLTRTCSSQASSRSAAHQARSTIPPVPMSARHHAGAAAGRFPLVVTLNLPHLQLTPGTATQTWAWHRTPMQQASPTLQMRCAACLWRGRHVETSTSAPQQSSSTPARPSPISTPTTHLTLHPAQPLAARQHVQTLMWAQPLQRSLRAPWGRCSSQTQLRFSHLRRTVAAR